MKKNIILLITILIIWSQEVESAKRLIMLCDRAEITDIGKGSPVSFSEIESYYNETYGSVFNFDMILSRDLISSKLKLAFEVVRCASKEALDTCEYYTKLTPPNVCLFINAKNVAWSFMTESFTPSLKCPLRKGTYSARSFTFDYNLWKLFPVEQWYWKITTRLYEGKLHLYTLLAECRVIPSRYGTV